MESGKARCTAEWGQGEASEGQNVRATSSQVPTLHLHNAEREHLLKFGTQGPSLVSPKPQPGCTKTPYPRADLPDPKEQ